MQTYRLPVTLTCGKQVFLPVTAPDKFTAFEQRRFALAGLSWKRVGFPRD